MNSSLALKIVVELIICAIFVIIAFLFVRILFSIKSTKRIKNFALNPNKKNVSFFDKIYSFFYKTIKILSKIVKKSVVLNNYSKYLEKYLIYSKSTLGALDHISLKIMYMIFTQILYIITVIVRSDPFNIFIFLILSISAFFIVDIFIVINYRKARNNIESQLLQAIVIMNGAFKSGKNILEAISIVKRSLPNPIKEEFTIIEKDINFGLDLDVVFSRFYDRVKVEEIKYITSSLALLNKTGGNIVTVFDMIEKHFYDRLKIKNELSALTSSSKFLYRMLLIIPFIFVLIIVLLNPVYFLPLTSHPLGIFLIVTMVIMYILYIFIIKRIVKVDRI